MRRVGGAFSRRDETPGPSLDDVDDVDELMLTRERVVRLLNWVSGCLFETAEAQVGAIASIRVMTAANAAMCRLCGANLAGAGVPCGGGFLWTQPLHEHLPRRHAPLEFLAGQFLR
jgi:hypothetical protein